MTIPSIIYKYKQLSSTEDLVRLMDILNHNRIYLPTYNQLNDPLEGQIINIETHGYAGYSMSLAADEEDQYIKAHKDAFRILSLSEEWNNPQLWAHYAGGYKGVCLCFSTQGVFGRINKIEYCKKREDEFTETEGGMDRLIKKSFYKKAIGWSYEKEWRIVSKSTKEHLKFQERDLLGIIIGHELKKDVCDFIMENTNRDLLWMKTVVGYRSFNIHAVRPNYKYDYNGVPIKTLDVEKALLAGKYVPVNRYHR